MALRFNARCAAGLLDGKSPGQPLRLNDLQRQAMVRMIESGPIPAIHGVVRWLALVTTRLMHCRNSSQSQCREMNWVKFPNRLMASSANKMIATIIQPRLLRGLAGGGGVMIGGGVNGGSGGGTVSDGKGGVSMSIACPN